MASHSDKQANVPPRYLEPPPFRGFFLTRGPSGPIPLGVSKSKRKALWVPLRGALEWYLTAVNRWGGPHPGWEPFERDLATEFGLLLLILASAKRQNSRRQILEAFLEHLNLADSRGRPRKAKEDLSDIFHGKAIDVLWNQEMQQVWNMKRSLERQGKEPRARLKKTGTDDDVISAVLSRRATPESSLARIYAKRSHVSVGRARNALRAYEKYTGKAFHTFDTGHPNEIMAIEALTKTTLSAFTRVN